MKLQECCTIFDEFCSSEVWQSSVREFLGKAGNATKWMIYSDYCLDDAHKPNDVISYVLMPFLGEEKYQEIDAEIHKMQSSDIKHVRTVNSEFLAYLKSLPFFSFSFVVNDRKLLFGDTGVDRLSIVLDILEKIKSQFEIWSENASSYHPVEYYDTSIRKLEKIYTELSSRKNVKLMQDVLLIAFLGALYSSKILGMLPVVEIVGWFPDRDKSNSAYDGVIMDIFNVMLYNRIPNEGMLLAYSGVDASVVPFYDNENRIVDYICGTIADYNIDENVVSKDKFSTVLKDLFADNSFCRIYRIKAKESPLRIGEIFVKKNGGDES